MTRQRGKAACGRLVRRSAFLLLFLPAALWPGPPFFTDDSLPIPRRSWEFYLASQSCRSSGVWSGTAPHLEVNYGAGSDLMLHIIVPAGFVKADGGPFNYGLGDVEIGSIYRLIKEGPGLPELGLFPHLELPTGSAARGFGTGRLRFFLPVWLAKHWGPWTTYGGGGFWVNPGPGNRNYWSAGLVVQRRISRTFEAGAEVFRNTPCIVGGQAETGFNVGVLWNVGPRDQVVLSAGRDIRGQGSFSMYVAYHLLLGPDQ